MSEEGQPDEAKEWEDYEGPPKKMIDDIMKGFGDAEVESWTDVDENGRIGYHWKRKEIEK